MGISTLISLESISAIEGESGDSQGLSALIPTIEPYRPSQWSQPALTMISVPATYTHTATNNSLSSGAAAAAAAAGSTAPTIEGTGTKATDGTPQMYVFDAVFRVGHNLSLAVT